MDSTLQSIVAQVILGGVQLWFVNRVLSRIADVVQLKMDMRDVKTDLHWIKKRMDREDG